MLPALSAQAAPVACGPKIVEASDMTMIVDPAGTACVVVTAIDVGAAPFTMFEPRLTGVPIGSVVNVTPND